MPDESNTGVPPGTVLTPSGSMTITQAGAVISAREITGSVTVNAPNVTIRSSRIQGNAFNLVRSNSSGLVVEDSEIVNQPSAGQPNCHNAIAFGGYTVLRTEITGCENGADMGAGSCSGVRPPIARSIAARRPHASYGFARVARRAVPRSNRPSGGSSSSRTAK